MKFIIYNIIYLYTFVYIYNIFKESDCTNIRVRNCISAKQRFLVKTLISVLLGGGENRISNSIYKTDRENKDHKMPIIGLLFLCRTRNAISIQLVRSHTMMMSNFVNSVLKIHSSIYFFFKNLIWQEISLSIFFKTATTNISQFW